MTDTDVSMLNDSCIYDACRVKGDLRVGKFVSNSIVLAKVT